MYKLKYYKDFNKINETGEWPKDVDWDFVKANPSVEDEYTSQILFMEEILNELIRTLESYKFIESIEIKDIKGFDVYQGAYGILRINDRDYKVWIIEYMGDSPYNAIIFIEHFFIDNSGEGEIEGYKGFISGIPEYIEKNPDVIRKVPNIDRIAKKDTWNMLKQGTSHKDK